MNLSEELYKESQHSDTTVLRLEPNRKLSSGSFERQTELAKDQKNTFNCNNDIFNIYDEKGNCYVTADAALVSRLSHDHKELKKDEGLGVELSNGMNFSYGPDAQKWNNIRNEGERRTVGMRQAEKEKAMKLAALRGTAKTEPIPVRKTELNNEMAGKMFNREAEM